jgi:ABC-type transport system involved in multi-copper enzyme maturation permease subunit
MWTIIKKELLNNVLSMRFTVILLILISVFIMSGYVFIRKYNNDLRVYSEDTNTSLTILQKASTSLGSIAYTVQTIHKRPRLLQLFCEGYEKSLPNTFRLDAFTVQIPEVSGTSNFVFPYFAEIDWVFIIEIIISFLAILLTFDSVSGEKEQHTLSLIISNAVPRDRIILGKLTGALVILLIPLLTGMVLNLIIIYYAGYSLDGNMWRKIIVFGILSILFLIFFLQLGLFISSQTHRSSTSIVVSLITWVILVIVVPACGRVVSEKYINVPGNAELQKRIEGAHQEIWKNIDKYGVNAGNWGPDLRAETINPLSRARLYAALTEEKNKIINAHINAWITQAETGRILTGFSPVILY